MKQFRFLEWNVYKDSQDLFTTVLKMVKTLPKECRYDLGSQVLRSSPSTLLNIAEGVGKKSDKGLNRFLEISLGSVYETVAVADILTRNALISREAFEQIQQLETGVAKQLGGFKKKINKL